MFYFDLRTVNMTSKYSAKSKLFTKWNQMYLKATDADRWNQHGEAIEQYERFSYIIQTEIDTCSTSFSSDQLRLLSKVCACLRLRARSLKNMSQCHPVTLSDMERLKPLMKNFSTWRAPFPVTTGSSIDSGESSATSSLQSFTSSADEDILSFKNLHGGKTLLPRLPAKPGFTRLTIKIKSIGLKDAATMIQPCVVVSVKDSVGLSIEPDQVVAGPLRTESLFLHYERNVEIPRYIEKIYKGSAIFFEVRHCKQKKRIMKTKCYTFLEPQSIKPGPVSLRLLQKPIDFSRKNTNFLTKKPLYLNLELTIHD